MSETNNSKNSLGSLFIEQLKKELKSFKKSDLSDSTESLVETMTDSLEDNIKESAIDKIGEATIDKLGDSIQKTGENIKESAIEATSSLGIENAALEASEGFIKQYNLSAEESAMISEVRAAAALKNTGTITGETVAENADTVSTNINTGAKIANAGATEVDAGANEANTGSLIKNTAATVKNTAAKVAHFAATHPLITGITIALSAAIYAWYKYSHTLDYTIKKHKELLEKQKEKLNVVKEEIESTNNQIESLNKLIDAYEQAVNGSEEYYEIANKIAELDPTLVIGYTSNGDAILADNNKLKEQLELYKETQREQLQERRYTATDTVDASSYLINDYKLKKKEFDDQITRIKREKEETEKLLEQLRSDPERSESADVSIAEGAIRDYEQQLHYILSSEEYKNATQDLLDAKKEYVSNLSYLFEDIPETLSDSELEYEKKIREFAIDIATSSEEALSSIDFLALYNNLKTNNNKNLLSELFNLDSNLSREQYKEEAERIYAQLIQSLLNSGFELSENEQLALRVALKIDDTSERNYLNNKNKFAQALGVNGVKSRQAQSWYDTLNTEDLKLVENHISDISQAVDGVSAENFVDSLNEALAKLKEIKDEVEDIEELTPQQISENVTSKLTSIESLYNSFYSDVLNGEKTSLDLDDVEGLRSNLVATDENPLGVSEEQFEEFERIVSDGTHSVQEMQQAFDELSTQFVDTALSLEGYTKENEALIKSQLELAGYTKESVDKYVDFKRAIYECNQQFKISEDGLHLDFANEQSRQKFLKNAHDAINKMHEETQKQSKMYGNVDIYQRPIIDNRDGSYSTTSTANMTYDSKNGNGELINIHATPILPNGEVWTDEKLDEYLSGIIKEATSNSDIFEKDKVENGGWGLIYQVDTTTMINGKKEPITAENLENAIMEGNAVDTAIHEVQDKIYSDEAELTVAVHIVEEGGDLTLQQLMLVAQYSDLAKDELLQYYVTKLTADGLTLSTVSDCEQLYNELKQLGINCSKLEDYIKLKSMAEDINSSGGNTSAYIAEMKGKAALGETVTADDVLSQIQESFDEKIKLINKNTAKDAGKEGADAYVEAFEKELKELDDLRDAGILSEKDYLDRLKALYIKYFANRKEYIKEFAKYEKQYLEGMQNLYNAAISAAITLLNDEKEDIEKAKDDALDALDDAKQNEIDPINDHIKALEEERDALQKERDALQEANDEREREMNLQKAQYELERANKQRTRLIYKNGQMQYVNDYQEVRNAKKNVEDAIFDKKIAAFDKQINNIDDQIDNLNKQLDEIDEKYQKLIDDTEKFYEDQIKGVQDLIDMWEKLQHQADLVEAYEALNNFGISAQDILSGNIDVFNQIRDGYIGTFAGLHQDIDAVSQAFGTNVENAQALKDALLGYDESTATFAQLKNDIDSIGNSASDAASKIGNGTEETSEGTLTGNLNKVGEAVNIVQEVSDALNGSENSLKNAVEDVGNTAEEVVPRVKTLFESLRDSIVDSVSVLGNMPNVLKDAIDDAITGTGYHKTVDGGAGFTGTAYANGNWSAKSKGLNGVALTGELGQELVVDSRTGHWHTVGDNGAEFAKIKSSDIVFNHKQTEELLKNGKINSRGKAYASGNNKFTALSSEELSKYNKLDFTKDLAEKLDFGNQKLMNIDKMVSNISTTKTVNSNPVFNIDNTFTCNGVSLADIQNELAKSFQGIFEAAYQKAMTK